jgi:TRAP-type C4-dicarboxylate transport system permease small subunit
MESRNSPAGAARPAGPFDRFERIARTLSKWLNWIAGAGLTVMLLLVVGDIIGIKIFSNPIPGGIEMVAFMNVVGIGFAIAYTQVLRGHIQVDFLVMKLPRIPRASLEAFTSFLGMAFFVILAWRSWDYARVLQASGEVSMTQRIPFYPFVFGLAFSYFVTFLVLTVDFIKAIKEAGR